jgi:hypothetical protein
MSNVLLICTVSSVFWGWVGLTYGKVKMQQVNYKNVFSMNILYTVQCYIHGLQVFNLHGWTNPASPPFILR